MIGFLRRFQPRNPALAFLYWLVLTAIAVAILFALFFAFERFLPGTDPGRVGRAP
jgi:hypothetical protein